MTPPDVLPLQARRAAQGCTNDLLSAIGAVGHHWPVLAEAPPLTDTLVDVLSSALASPDVGVARAGDLRAFFWLRWAAPLPSALALSPAVKVVLPAAMPLALTPFSSLLAAATPPCASAWAPSAVALVPVTAAFAAPCVASPTSCT